MAESSLKKDYKLSLCLTNLQGTKPFSKWRHRGCGICWDGHIRVHSKECMFQHKSNTPWDTCGIGRGFRGCVWMKACRTQPGTSIGNINDHTIFTALQKRAFHLRCRSAALNTACFQHTSNYFMIPMKNRQDYILHLFLGGAALSNAVLVPTQRGK